MVNSNICITKFYCNAKILQNAILSLMKIKTNFRSLPMKEFSRSATLYLFIIFLTFFVMSTDGSCCSATDIRRSVFVIITSLIIITLLVITFPDMENYDNIVFECFHFLFSTGGKNNIKIHSLQLILRINIFLINFNYLILVIIN